MPTERCDECGFDGDEWTDADALATVAGLPDRWRAAIAGLSDDALTQRPIGRMWSIAEYTDHVRETIFGMRFLLDTALDSPGAALDRPPESRFDPEPRRLDSYRALAGFETEVQLLADRLRQTLTEGWTSSWAVLDGDRVDTAWIVRHAVHDVTHHLGDVGRLRAALG